MSYGTVAFGHRNCWPVIPIDSSGIATAPWMSLPPPCTASMVPSTMSPSKTARPSTSAYWTPFCANVTPRTTAVPAIGPDRCSPPPSVLPWLPPWFAPSPPPWLPPWLPLVRRRLDSFAILEPPRRGLPGARPRTQQCGRQGRWIARVALPARGTVSVALPRRGVSAQLRHPPPQRDDTGAGRRSPAPRPRRRRASVDSCQRGVKRGCTPCRDRGRPTPRTEVRASRLLRAASTRGAELAPDQRSSKDTS